ARLRVLVVDEVSLYVEDELALHGVSALGGPGRIGRLRLRDVEQVTEHLVHRHERRGHAAAGAKELAPIQTLPGAVLVRQLLDARLDLLLLRGLRQWVELSVGDDLGGNRRRKRVFRRLAFRELTFA